VVCSPGGGVSAGICLGRNGFSFCDDTGMKLERLGTIIMVLGTIAFFASIRMNTFPFFSLLNLIPLFFFGFCWMVSYYQKSS